MRRILLVDDDEGIRDLWKEFHEVTEPVFRGQLSMDVASDIAAMQEKMRRTEYDAIILDLAFIGQGADDTVTFIAQNSDKMPPIIVLTGNKDIWIRRRCMMFGASDFWIKEDAQANPLLFFKAVYNRYLYKRDAPKL